MTADEDEEGQGLDEAHLDLADDTIQRARAGEDVGPRLERLPPAVRQGVLAALDLERRILRAGPAAPPPSRPSVYVDPWPGQTLSGCTLARLLGRGGMGAAYLARRADGQEVVVKLLQLDAAPGDRKLERFRREADALRRVRQHPNVVSVLGGSLEGQPHLVLEYVPGPTLEALVRERGRIAPAAAARLALDVVRGLGVLHGHGLLHRDVKPANVVVAPDGRARLIDFGIAKDLFLSGLTEPGQLVGTAEYMSPEQWTGEAQDARTDLFALGATLYHLLAGRPPFVGDGLDELMELATTGDYPPLRELVPEAPLALERLVTGLLEPSPRFRYARAEQVAEDLERALAGEQPANLASLVRVGEDGRALERRTLPPLPRFVVGAGPRAQLRLADGPGLAAEHLEVSRDGAGFCVRDLKSPAGSWLGAERLTTPRPVEDGDALRLGSVRLLVADPGGRPRPPAWLDDLTRVEQPDVVVSALVRAGDPAAVVALIELLSPDPLADRAADALLRSVGGPAAPALLARRARLVEEARAAAAALLVQASGEALGADPVAWLAWLFQARPRLAPQVGVTRPARALRLVPGGSERACTVVAQGADRGVFLVGRDERCHLRLAHPTVSRLHATVLRLHRRLAIRDEGGAGGIRLGGLPCHVGFLDPGTTATVGQVAVTVEGGEAAPPREDGARVVDLFTFQALDEGGHPSALAGHVAALEAAERLPAQLPALVRSATSDPRRVPEVERLAREGLAARAARARAALARALGRDAGPSPAAWRQLLAPAAQPVVAAGVGA